MQNVEQLAKMLENKPAGWIARTDWAPAQEAAQQAQEHKLLVCVCDTGQLEMRGYMQKSVPVARGPRTSWGVNRYGLADVPCGDRCSEVHGWPGCPYFEAWMQQNYWNTISWVYSEEDDYFQLRIDCPHAVFYVPHETDNAACHGIVFRLTDLTDIAGL